jgi:hypothetical protein
MLSFNPTLLPSSEMNKDTWLTQISSHKVPTKHDTTFEISSTQASPVLYSFFTETGVGQRNTRTSYLHLMPMLSICGVPFSRPLYALIVQFRWSDGFIRCCHTLRNIGSFTFEMRSYITGKASDLDTGDIRSKTQSRHRLCLNSSVAWT